MYVLSSINYFLVVVNTYVYCRSSHQHNKKVAATAKKIFTGEQVTPLKAVSSAHALWLITLGEGFGKKQYRYI